MVFLKPMSGEGPLAEMGKYRTRDRKPAGRTCSGRDMQAEAQP